MNVTLVDKDNELKYLNFVESLPESNFFHSLIWREVIKEVYGFEPVYCIVTEGDEVKAACPAFLTKSIVFGRKILTTPFNFYNGPLYMDPVYLNKITEFYVELAKKNKAKYVEYKCIDKMSCGLTMNEHYYISLLDLPRTYDEAFSKFEHGLRRNVKRRGEKAKADGLVLKEMTDMKELEDFYTVMVKTLRDKHNMIPQPFLLFKSLYERLHKTDNIKVLLVKKGDEIAGGMILLVWKNIVTDAWTATNEKYNAYSPNTLLADYAIRYSIEKGKTVFDMGVTSPAHESLLYFKSSWGCKYHKMPYYYDLITEKNVPELDYHTSFRGMRKLFRFVPVPLIKVMSPTITRQLG